jgi:hypothetical protein
LTTAPKEQLQLEALAAYRETRDYRAAAKKLGISKSTLWDRVQAAERKNLGNTFSGGEAPPGFIVKKATPLYDEAGDKKLEWVQYVAEAEETQLAKQAIFEEMSDMIDRVKPLPRPKVFDEDLLTVYPIVDHHTGMKAWSQETRDADYDLDIAIELLQGTMTKLVSRSLPSKTAVVLSMGDFIHSDTNLNKTLRSGNVLDVDGRHSKIALSSVRLLRNCIDTALQVHDNVIVRILPGNHDDHTAYMLSVSLACLYEKEKRVDVDLDPSLFWMTQWGSTMLGATHGHTCKPPDVPLLMASLEKEIWGATDYRYAFMGHVHHRAGSKMLGGVYVETLETLAPKDAWAAGKFINNRSMTSITYHKRDGEYERQVVNVPRPEQKPAPEL